MSETSAESGGMNLWSLQLMFCGAQARTVNLVYQSEDAARAAVGRITASAVQSGFPVFSEADSYGTEVHVFGGGPLEAVQLQGIGRAGEGGIELALAQARVQARAQERGAKDPVLREAQERAQQKQALVRALPMPGMSKV
jgi:hypothetical protein